MVHSGKASWVVEAVLALYAYLWHADLIGGLIPTTGAVAPLSWVIWRRVPSAHCHSGCGAVTPRWRLAGAGYDVWCTLLVVVYLVVVCCGVLGCAVVVVAVYLAVAFLGVLGVWFGWVDLLGAWWGWVVFCGFWVWGEGENVKKWVG